eukprot:evm.model.scf_2660.2 EVM.evm.TU.scf_2660.2   scf_2660:10804-11601(+)
MAKEFKVRFRHTAGDLGPFVFAKDATVTQVKDHVLAQWPKDGAFASEPPAGSGEIRFILSGKFVDDTRALFDYTKEMGDPDKDSIVTMHLVVRKTATPGKGGKGGEPTKCSCCSIQ